MIDQKQEFIEHLAYRLPRAAAWRQSQAEKFPNDKRNLRAAERLRALATDMNVPDAIWANIRTHFDPCSPRWLDAISTTSREVGFRTRPNDFSEYLETLISNLSKPTRY
jgi:hypothetical protein